MSKLLKEIEEVRSILYEICLTSNNDYNDKLRLKISQYLDRLIVQYMKQIEQQK